ncbi:MAG: DUF4838 domain-containing protein, partial [Kiritimatiellota bacterium]|nr:DUF4838 domain-containing protein [Kiritimatiellota bacterium]
KGLEIEAAATLEIYLKLATGAAIVRCKEGAAPAGLAQIHVGDTKVGLETPLDLPPARYGDIELPNMNGYLIKTVNPQTLVIRGATPAATLLGAVGLLKHFLGVRRYWPGEPGGIGDVVPKSPTLKLPQLEWRDWPYFISRIMSGCDDRGPRAEVNKGTSFLHFWRMNYTIPSNESYYRLLNAIARTNEPDLFPLIDGKRFVPRYGPDKRDPNGWQPCVSNPKVAELMAESIKETFRKNPLQMAESLSVNDGYGDCGCDKCRAMDAPGADVIRRVGLCDRYIKFDNQVADMVAKEFPDRLLGFIAYGSMTDPPQTVKLHRMLAPVLCSCGNFFQSWDEWARTGARNMGVYWYHDDAWFIMPKLDIHQSAKRIRYIVGSGLARSFYQEFYGIYPLDGMVGYVEQELIWDPRLNEDELLAEYYQKFFGPAAAPMKSFYTAVESDYTRWLNKYGKPHPYGYDITSITDSKSVKQFSVLSVETALKAQSCLESALAAAKGEQVVEDRVRLVKTLFNFAVLGSRMYWAGERLRNVEMQSASLDKITADAREAVDSGLALADYKFDVMEKPEIKAYEDHGKRDPFYNQLTRGSVHAEILGIIGMVFNKVSEHQNKTMGAEQAAALWQTCAQKETRPVLQRLMKTAAFDAGGSKLENLVKDPGYEERGPKQLASTNANAEGHLTQGGADVWCGAGSPMNCSLTDEDTHGGKYSFVFWQTQHAGVRESVSVKEGDILRMSVWVKHNEQDGRYVVQAFPRG